MIMIIESDRTVQKKLGDLLSTEQFMVVNSITDALEKICLHKNEIDLIITNVQILRSELEHQTIAHLCAKLCTNQPPMLCLYRKGEACQGESGEAGRDFVLLEFDEDDPGFPMKYFLAITEKYPQVHVDIRQATAVWSKGKANAGDDLADLHKWLEQEGVSLADGKKLDKATENQQAQEKDYKEMYFELKEKYDKLLAYVKELLDSVKDKDG